MMAASKTTNFGSTWTRYNLSSGTGRTYCIAIDPDNSNIVYAGGDEGGSVAIYRTTTGGSSWSKSPATGLSGTHVYSIAIDPDNTSILYAGTNSNCYRSTNSGATWTSTSCPGGQINTVLVNRGSAIYEGVYAGSETNGVYYSTNEGSSWIQINDGLTDLEVNCLSLSENMYVFAGTQDGGIHRWSIAVGKEEHDFKETLKSVLFALPNPFIGKTTLWYQLFVKTPVNVSLYDVGGRLVTTFVDGVQEAGVYTVQWNGCDENNMKVAAGVYLCRLTSNGSTRIHKLVFMK